MIIRIALICYLAAASIIDIIKKKLPLAYLAAGVIPVSVGICAELFIYENSGYMDVIFSHGAGILVGAMFLLVSILTREKLGKADAILFCLCGGTAGYGKLMTIIMSAFLLGALYAVAMLAIGRMKRNSSFAFAPFIFAGYIMTEILLNGV